MFLLCFHAIIYALVLSTVNDVFVESSCTYLTSIERDDVILIHVYN